MNIPQLLLTLPRPLLRPRNAYPLVCLLAVLAFASLATLPAQAAQPAGDPPAQQRRLVLEVDMTRQGRVSNGAEAGQEQRRQHWRVALVFSNGGERTTSNPFDPRSGDAALAQAQRAQAQAGLGFTPEQLAVWQQQAALLQQRCGQDSACMAREGLKLTAPAAPRPTGPVIGADADMPYLVFSPVQPCRLEVQVQIDARLEGSFADVQGQVPFSETTRASESLRPAHDCATAQALLDTRNRRLWAYLGAVPRSGQGSFHREVRGRAPVHQQGAQQIEWREAQKWLDDRLLNLNDSSGTDRFVQPVPGGQIDVSLRWRFERL